MLTHTQKESITTKPPTTSTPAVSSTILSYATKADVAAFLYDVAFSPVLSTFVRAISCDYLISCPGLTTDIILRYLPNSVATTTTNQQRYVCLQCSTQP